MKALSFAICGLISLLIGCVLCKENTSDSCIWDGIAGAISHEFPPPYKNMALLPVAKKSAPQKAGWFQGWVLEWICPKFYKQNQRVCCSIPMILPYIMMKVEMFKMNVCEQCTSNILELVCEFSCSPKQALTHVGTKETITIKGSKSKETVISNVVYNVNQDVMNKIENSCNNVDTFRMLRGSEMPALQRYLTIAFQLVPGANVKFNWSSNAKTSANFSEMIVSCNESLSRHSFCKCNGHSCPKYECEANAGHIDKVTLTGVSGSCVVLNDAISCSALGLCVIIGCVAVGIAVGIAVRKENRWTKLCCLRKKCKELRRLVSLFLTSTFTWWGRVCASHPWLMLILSIIWAVAMTFGLLMDLKPITSPTDLWSSPKSRSRQDKAYFDKHFGGFYRTTQIIFVPKKLQNKHYHGIDYTNALSYKETLKYVKYVVDEIKKVNVTFNDKTYGLDQFCLKPMSPNFNSCLIFAPTQYIHDGDFSKMKHEVDVYDACVAKKQLACANNGDIPVLDLKCNGTLFKSMNCSGEYGGPVRPYLVYGGYPPSKRLGNGFMQTEYNASTAVIVTLPLHPVDGKSEGEQNVYRDHVEAWELAFVNMMKKGLDDDDNHNWVEIRKSMDVAYSVERSIEDAIVTESKASMVTILLSYGGMVIYVTLALGEWSTNLKRIIVHAKVTVALCGVIIVALSVTASVGFFSLLKERPTMIIYEVVPFLVLAVGVDNIFILVQALQRRIRRKTYDLQLLDGDKLEAEVVGMMGTVIGDVGPSMLLTSTTESVAIFFGALSKMPAVYIFSLYAGLAVIVNFGLQITAFVAVLSLDTKRALVHEKADVACCYKPKGIRSKRGGTKFEASPKEPFLVRFFGDYWARVVLWWPVRVATIIGFLGITVYSVWIFPLMTVGFGTTTALPPSSIAYGRLMAIEKYFRAGTPLYFVAKDGINYTDYTVQNKFCSDPTCDPKSVVNIINRAAKDPKLTYIEAPASDWLTTYFMWFRSSSCCRYKNTTINGLKKLTRCHKNNRCTACNSEYTMNTSLGRPKPEHFMTFLNDFLADVPDESCPFGGHPLFGSAVKIIRDDELEYRVGSTYYEATLVSESTPDQYTNGIRSARKILAEINNVIGDDDDQVFSYNYYDVYNEQYLTTRHDVVVVLAICFLVMFIISTCLLGPSLLAGIIVTINVAMITISMFAAMNLVGIALNAVSMVNLVICAGISVEFSSHMVRRFCEDEETPKDRVSRARRALATIGTSVFSGITMTKIVGGGVLLTSSMKLLSVYFGRMFVCIVVSGALHGLIFLPVLLTVLGPIKNEHNNGE